MDSTAFMEFLDTVSEENRGFAADINDFLIRRGCICDIKPAKSGPVVSYTYKETKKTLATFICRKSGVKLRIYPQNLNQYEEFLGTLPAKMKKEIIKASVCKRLINPDDCNPRCVKGYDFYLDGEHYQKCRYMAFQLTLSEESSGYIKVFLEKEVDAH